MNTTSITRVALAFLSIFIPTFALAQTSIVGGISSSGSFLGISFGTGAAVCTNNLCSIAQTILYLINSVLVPLLFALAFIVFLYGIASAYIFSGGDVERVNSGHRLILWGIIGFVVMISLWGLVNVVANTFGLSGFTAPPLPTSY